MRDTARADQQTEVGTRFDVPHFVAAAHELKSPLALVRQMALTLESDGISESEVAELAKRIRLTSERSLHLVQDLTLMGRLDAPALFELEPLNPATLCEEVVREMTPLYQAHKRKLQVRSYRRPPLVVGNRRLLRSVLIQFADNALRYAETDEPVVLTMTATRDGGRVEIGVRDFGPALSTDIWKRLSTLGQTPQPITRRPDSSGLGLMVAQRFAEAMQGRVGATRHRDGASFYISLMGSTQTSLL